MTNQEAFQKTKQKLLQIYSEGEASSICRWLFQDVFKISPSFLLTKPNEPFKEVSLLLELQGRLLNHEPVQHILGYTFFDSLKIRVSKEVLIPRPETEELLLLIKLNENKPLQTLVDICSGSGCLTLGLRKHFPNSQISGLDISEAALSLARKSELDNFNNLTIQWQVFDVLKDHWTLEKPQLVVCNPPYIGIEEKAFMDLNVLEHEPQSALFVYNEDILLFYKKVIELFQLDAFPKIYFELNPLSSDKLSKWCLERGLSCNLVSDMQGKTRFAIIHK